MVLIFVFVPPILLLLWLLAIRPYCRKHGKGYTTGANFAVAAWIDWQEGREIAARNGDSGMLLILRLFLALHIVAFVAFVGIIARSFLMGT